jgi:hypothetical protein
VDLGLFQQVEIDRLKPEVPAAARNLIAQKLWVETVNAAGDPIRVDQPWLDVGLDQITARRAPGLCNHGIDREVAPLGDHHDFVTRGIAIDKRAPQCHTQRAFAGLHAIRERRVEEVDSALEQLGYGGAVEQVIDSARVAVAQT